MKKYISDLITKEEMEKWKNDDIIAITSGTGTGKSYFTTKKVTKFAKERGERILFLVPRSSIAEQLKLELDLEDTHITVTTFQWLETSLRKEVSVYKTFDYIIMDEAHYFLEDSQFNLETESSFQWVMNQDVKRILLSATSKSILTYLGLMKKEINQHYSIENNFSTLKKIVFLEYEKDNKVELLTSILKKIPKKEKALVFTRTIEEALELFETFQQSATLYFSEHNKRYARKRNLINKSEYQQLLKTGKIPKQIFITTSVLEAGVTIRDKNLKHIILESAYETNLIQSIGRKRIIDSEDTFTLYLSDFSAKQLNGHIQVCRRQKDILDDFLSYENPKDFLKQYPHLRDTNGNPIHGITLEHSEETSTLELRLSKPFYSFLIQRMDYLNKVKDFSEIDGYKNYFANLLNKDIIKECTTMTLNKKEFSLYEYLDSFIGYRIYEKDEKSELIERINYRVNGRIIRSPKQLSEGLKKMNMPYIITSAKDRQTIIESWGTKVKNPYFNKTYWSVFSTEDVEE